MNHEVVLKLSGIYKFYKMGENVVKAVNGVDLTIKRGAFVSIVGPSGSGKSTLMHMIGCLDNPTKGKVILSGEDVSKFSEDKLALVRNEKIGFVFQSFNLLARTSALDNVILPLRYRGLRENEAEKLGKKALEKVGLGDRIDHFPNQLSGGQQQRVAIARAIVTDPTIILGDEPTGNLDSKSGKEVIKIFKELYKKGKTVILVTHDMNVAAKAKRLIKIMDGKIV